MAITTVNWMPGQTYGPREDRLLIDGIMTTPGVDTHDSFVVRQKPTPSLKADVSQGSAFVSGTWTTHQGQYHVYNDGNIEIEFDEGSATNNRIDLVSLVVEDSQYTRIEPSQARIIITKGYPAGSPNKPLSPPDSIDLASVLVRKGAQRITKEDIQIISPRATAAGGIAYVRNYQELTEGLPRIDGLHAYRKDIDRLMVCDGISWKYINTTPATDTGWRSIPVASKYQASKTQYRAYGDMVFTRGAIKGVQGSKKNLKKFIHLATMNKSYAPTTTLQVISGLKGGKKHMGVEYKPDGRMLIYVNETTTSYCYISTSWLR